MVHFLFCLPGHAVFCVAGVMYYSPNERIWLFPGVIANRTMMAEFTLGSFQKTDISFNHGTSSLQSLYFMVSLDYYVR